MTRRQNGFSIIGWWVSGPPRQHRSPRSVGPTKGPLYRATDWNLAHGELTTAIKATESRLSQLLEDRGRIGRDLHDGVLQSLYAIGLNIETSQRTRSHHTAESKEADDRMIHQLNQLIHEVRGMIRELESGTCPGV